MQRTVLFFTAAVAAFSIPLAAQAPLTLDECVHRALAAPSSLTLARQERAIADRDITQARAGFLPQSRLVNGFTYNSPLLDNPGVFSFIPLNAIREYATLFTVNEEFDTSGRLRAEYARARANQDIAAAGIRLTERDLKRAVTGAYYRVLVARRFARIAADVLEEGRSFEKRTRLLFEHGEAAQADVVKAAAQAAAFEQALNAAELEAKLANQDLASFWTRDVADPLPLADVLDQPAPPPEGEAPSGTIFLRRFEFNLLDAQRRGFQADVRRARAGLLPQLGLTFQYGIDSSAIRIRDRGYATFVNFTIPIFDWSKTLAAMRQAQLRAAQVDTNRAISERLFSRDYQAALARVKQLYEQIGLTHRQADLAEQDLRLSRIRYEGGEGSALDVVTAQSQLAQARTNYYTAIGSYLNAKADLEVASGR